MAFEVIIVDEALVELLEEVNNIAAFDVAAAVELDRLFNATCQSLAENPELYQIAIESKGQTYRRFSLKSRVVVYTLHESVVYVLRVFGPGEDWQQQF